MPTKTHNLHSLPDLPHSGDKQPIDWFAQTSSIIIATVVLFILIFGTAIFLSFRHFEDARDLTLTSDKVTANLLADVIMEHNNATVGILQSYAHRRLFINAVKNKDVTGVHRHLSDLKKNGEVDLTFVTDKRGVLWANFPVFPEAIGKDLSSRDWYQGISTHWKPYISKVFKLIVGDKPLAAAICVPIIDEKEMVIGILATSQRLGFIDDIVRRVPFSPHTRVTVIDRAGQILYSNIYSYRENIMNHPLFPAIKTALKDKQQQIEIKNPQNIGEKIDLFVVPVGITGWSIIVGRTQSDILRLEFKRFVELGVVSFLLLLLCVSVLVYLRKVSLFRKTEELLRTEAKLRESDARFQEVLDNSLDVSYKRNLQTDSYDYLSPGFAKNYGYDPAEMKNLPLKDLMALIHPDDLSELGRVIAESNSGAVGTAYHMKYRFRHKEGPYRWCHDQFTVMRDADGTPLAIIGSVRDITEQKQAEEALRERVKELNCIYSIADLIEKTASIDELFQGIVNQIPPAWYYPDHACARITLNDQEFKTVNFQDTVWKLSADIIVLGKPIGVVEVRYLDKMPDRDEGPFLQEERDLINAIAERLGRVMERKWAEEALRKSEERYHELSIIDGLTQLYNSRHFYLQLKNEIERSNRHGQPLTILLLDLDNYKAFNDAYGHIEGDQVLLRLGQVLKRCLRQTDSAYRYGGEEFTILLPMTTSKNAAVTAERIRTEFKKEIFSPAPGQDIHMTVSIGLAQYKTKEEMKVFVNRVDQLMYQAKNNGKDRVCSEA